MTGAQRLVLFVLCLAIAVTGVAGARDYDVNSVDNALDLCATSENPASKVVTPGWYRSVPYEIWMPADQDPVYFDSGHLGVFEGVHLDGIVGSTEASRIWTVRQLRPGETLTIPPSYQNLENFAFVPDCGNLGDNSGTFNLKARPAGWGTWPSLPSAGSGVAAALDPVTGAVYVFGGGCNNGSYTASTWWLDPRGYTGWQEISPGDAGPEARWFASAVYDQNPGGNRRMIIYGGASASQTGLNDTWALDLVTHVWTALATTGAPGCYYHRAVLDPNPGGNRRMLIYGDALRIGRETYALDLVTLEWSLLQVETEAPPLRYLPGLALYEAGDGQRQMIAFGGGYNSLYRNDIWSLNLQTLNWTQLPAGPIGTPGTREGATLVADSPAGMLIAFGGRSAQATYSDLWYYDLNDQGWVPVNFPLENWPAARTGHAMVYDQEYGAAVILGGSVAQQPCDEPTVAVYVSDFEWFGAITGAPSSSGSDGAGLSSRAWPVPSAELTRIEFDLPESGEIQGAVFDVSGARVRELLDAALPAGTHRVEWDGRSADGTPAPAGVYFYRLTANGRSVAGKIVRRR